MGNHDSARKWRNNIFFCKWQYHFGLWRWAYCIGALQHSPDPDPARQYATKLLGKEQEISSCETMKLLIIHPLCFS